MTRPPPPKKRRGLQIVGRVAAVKAVLLLLQKPYRATELAEALGMHIRITYRILNDLRATGDLCSHRCYYWFQPKKHDSLEHLIPVKDPNE